MSCLKHVQAFSSPYLVPIYRAILRLKIYPAKWKDSTTCVLWKPGKPRYDVPKAYRPIALLNTLAKLLSSIIAEGLSYLTETHQLILPTHFGDAPGGRRQIPSTCSWIRSRLRRGIDRSPPFSSWT